MAGHCLSRTGTHTHWDTHTGTHTLEHTVTLGHTHCDTHAVRTHAVRTHERSQHAHTHTGSHTHALTHKPHTGGPRHTHSVNALTVTRASLLVTRHLDFMCHPTPQHFLFIRIPIFSNFFNIEYLFILRPDLGVSRHADPRNIYNLCV